MTDHDPGAPDAAAPGTARPEPTGWVERLVCSAGEDEETRRRKVQFTIASVLVAPAGDATL